MGGQMERDKAFEESFSDQRISSFRSKSGKDAEILSSPEGRPVARAFGLDMNALSVAPEYAVSERLRIIEQISVVLRDFYVHLGMKEAQFGFDAIRALDRLAPVAAKVSDEEFQQSVVQVITRTRDRHLVFWGRSPNGVSAVLPFEIERCWITGVETFVVTKIDSNFDPEHLKVGAIVDHWNGTPIARHVRLLANFFDAGNESALLARAMEFLTRRPLERFAWPIESWVTLGFEVDGEPREERFDWQGFDIGEVPLSGSIGRNVIGFGGDAELFNQQRVKRAQFAWQSFDAPVIDILGQSSDGTPMIIGQKDNFGFGSVTTEHGTYGYFRLYDFSANSVDDIASDVIDALPQIPQTGLIIDMRGNTGGYIAAGEMLLQLFTPKRITRTRFQFRVTAGTRRMMAATTYFDRWRQSFEEAHRTGEQFSQGYPIEGTDDDANRLGQRYFGPVVVVTDALALSTADMFVAGFIDHAVGRVICIDKNMAAAGGNNWSFDLLRLFVPDFALDHAHESELEAGTLSDGLKSAFNGYGVSLSDAAVLSASGREFGGRVWTIDDDAMQHQVRDVSWLSSELLVYPNRSRSGLETLPDDLYFGFTVRRCVRTGPSEGRLLEDLGIKPDVVYQPTLRDVLGQNQDLITRATHELSTMPAYKLGIDSAPQGGGIDFTLRVRKITYLEVTFDGKHFASFEVGAAPLEFSVPSGITTVVIRGYDGENLVARRIVEV